MAQKPIQNHSIYDNIESNISGEKSYVQEKKSLIDKQSDQEDGQILLCNKIILRPNISKIHFGASMLHYLAMPFLFVSVEVLQPILFSDKFGIEPQDQGPQNANVLLVDILTKIVFAPVFGILNDKFGRQIVLLYGIIMATLGLCLMPLSSGIYPYYLLCRILYAHGAIAIATIPLLADYVNASTKGKACSLAVIGASLGAVLSSSGINFLTQKGQSVQKIYWILAAVYCSVSVLYTLHLKRGVYFLNDARHSKNCQKLIQIGFKASKCPWILMGYVTNFIGRGDSILLTLFLVLWSYNKNGKNDYHDSEIQAETLSGVCYTVVLLFSIAYGLLFERISKFKTLAAIFCFTALGCFMFNFASDPKGIYSFVVMIIIGIGLSGLYTAALFLINQYAESEYRGYITGLSNIFSVLGIVTCTLSGYALDTLSFAFPFTFFGILCVICLLILVVSYIFHLRKYKIWKEEMVKLDIYKQFEFKNNEEEDEVYKKQYDYLFEKQKNYQ